MRTLKGWITTTCMVAMLMVSTMTANAGVIIGGVVEQPCTDTTTTKEGKVDFGVIIGGLTVGTGVIIGGLVGVIIGGISSTDEQVDCGVIIGG